MAAVVNGGGGEMGKQCDQQAGDRLVGCAECLSAPSHEQEAQGHANCHVVAMAETPHR